MSKLNISVYLIEQKNTDGTIGVMGVSLQVSDAAPPFASHSGGSAYWSNLPDDAGAAMIRSSFAKMLTDLQVNAPVNAFGTVRTQAYAWYGVDNSVLSRVQDAFAAMLAKVTADGRALASTVGK